MTYYLMSLCSRFTIVTGATLIEGMRRYIHPLVAVFFLGGWRGPFLPPVVWFLIKILVISVLMIWVRGTLPRLRYDQLMALGWKVLIPASLINIIVTGAILLL